jgi:hypothetical protein
MAFDFNPITGQLDLVGGGDSYIDGESEYHSSLPVTVGTPAINSAFLVRKGEGLYFLTRKPAGIWVRELNNGNLNDWKYAGTFSDLYRDANFRILNDADVSKELAFSLSGIAAGTTRTITMPNANVTLPNQGTSTGDSPTYAQITINDTDNDVSTLTLSNDAGSNKIEFEAHELTLRHTGTSDTPYINVTDGTDYALLGVRQGDMFLQGSNAVVRIEQNGGTLANIKVNKLVLEAAATAGDPTATFDADGNLTANRIYDLPNASGTLALTSNFAAPPAIGNTTPNSGAFSTLSVGATNPNITVVQLGNRPNNTLTAYGTSYGSTSLEVAFDGGLNILNGVLSFGNGDAALLRDAANTLAQRNGSNAQTFRLYGFFGYANIFERLSIRAQFTNNFIIATEKGTTGGVARGLEFQTDSVARLTLGSAGGVTVNSGNLTLTDNTGAETATFDAQAKLTANRTYDLPDRSGVMVVSDTSAGSGSDVVNNIVSLTQAEYNAIGSPDSATLFLITDP